MHWALGSAALRSDSPGLWSLLSKRRQVGTSPELENADECDKEGKKKTAKVEKFQRDVKTSIPLPCGNFKGLGQM